ncbi:hypothetical protein [Streptomyces avermitilis]|uniref:hypothetical protein n=1 Tax=Streptomyces avermitilis TaxID=33903 RepID=UPI0033B39B4E
MDLSGTEVLEVDLSGTEVEDGLTVRRVVPADEELAVGVVEVVGSGGRRALGDSGELALRAPKTRLWAVVEPAFSTCFSVLPVSS